MFISSPFPLIMDGVERIGQHGLTASLMSIDRRSLYLGTCSECVMGHLAADLDMAGSSYDRFRSMLARLDIPREDAWQFGFDFKKDGWYPTADAEGLYVQLTTCWRLVLRMLHGDLALWPVAVS